MAGRKGRSGPPNNVNALKPQNEAELLWRRGRRRRDMTLDDNAVPRDAWVKKPIKDTFRAFAADLPDMTAREREIVHTIGIAKGCELLIIDALNACGLVSLNDNKIEVAKASEDLGRFMKIKLDGLRLLPVSRRAKLVGDDVQAALRIKEAFSAESPDEEESS